MLTALIFYRMNTFVKVRLSKQLSERESRIQHLMSRQSEIEAQISQQVALSCHRDL